MATPEALHFQFTGQGKEYFRIWITHLCLNLITLGVYSAWAKVNENQYFCQHTRLDGKPFHYHGNPLTILKGRLIAAGLCGSCIGLSQSNLIAAGIMLVIILSVLPWMLQQTARFKLHNISYRGLRFGFYGTTKGAAIYWVLFPIASVLTLGLWPIAQRYSQHYTRENSAYGSAYFRLETENSEYYRIYLIALVLIVLMYIDLITVALVMGLLGAFPNGPDQLLGHSAQIAAFSSLVGLYFFIYPFISARLQNLTWNNTGLEKQRFVSNVHATELAHLIIVNTVLIILTAGLYKPFADIKLARYRLEHLKVLPSGDLNEFLKNSKDQVLESRNETFDISL